MKAKTRTILDELYAIDPSLKERETDLEQIIEKLSSADLKAEIDGGFREKLKARLLKEFHAKPEPFYKRFFTPRLILAFSGGLAAVALTIGVAVILTRPQPSGEVVAMVPVTITEKSSPMEKVTKQETQRIVETKARESTILRSDFAGSADTKSATIELQSGKGYIDGDSEVLTYNDSAYNGTVSPGMVKDADGRASLSQDQSGEFNTEEYAKYKENAFLKSIDNPLSTFSIDVDTASYANVRRFITSGELPPPDAVRIEELVNYFTYDYPQPSGDDPFAFSAELSVCPWEDSHRLLAIGIQGKKVDLASLPPSNLVFLLDVSGSMDEPGKLPLLKQALSLLARELRPTDRVAIAVYAGAAGLALPSTPGSQKETILAALDNLEAGGSTAGSEGILLAYETAQKNFIQGGNNRIILATDGDFNVGPSSDGELIRLIEEKRKQGVYLTVLGFGTGNVKDTKMEQMADKGNGNYSYIDSLGEAKKVLVRQLGGTLFTIAKDVKIQVEFNPARVESYRLIGYSNRMLAKEDFEDDTKDAGELGSGHTVTALYEIVPARDAKRSAELKYQTTTVKEQAYASEEVVTLKLRYKKPDAEVSQPMEKAIRDDNVPLQAASNNFRFAAAVAEWGLILSHSEYKGKARFTQVLDLARNAMDRDEEGYRKEFLSLVEASEALGK
jgi:Ca-activated chloride channel homolog